MSLCEYRIRYITIKIYLALVILSFHQLFNLDRSTNLNKPKRALISPRPLHKTRYSYIFFINSYRFESRNLFKQALRSRPFLNCLNMYVLLYYMYVLLYTNKQIDPVAKQTIHLEVFFFVLFRDLL